MEELIEEIENVGVVSSAEREIRYREAVDKLELAHFRFLLTKSEFEISLDRMVKNIERFNDALEAALFQEWLENRDDFDLP